MALNPIIPQLQAWVGRQDRLSHEPEGPRVDTDRITQVIRVLRALEDPLLDWTLDDREEVLDYLARVTYRTTGSQGTEEFTGGTTPLLPPGLDLSQYVRFVNGIAPDPTTGNVTITTGEGAFTLSGITEFLDRFPTSKTGTAQDFFRTLLIRFQVPAYTFFLVDGVGSRTVEIGTVFPTAPRTFTWGTSNPGNITPNSLLLTDVTGNTTLSAGQANTGTLTVSTTGFTVVPGLSRKYRIRGTDTQATFFQSELDIYGDYLLFYGPTSAVPTTRSQALALSGSSLGGTSGILITGTTATRFLILVPPGKTLTSVTDLDNLNANLLTSYVAQSPVNLANAGGSLVAYTPYLLTAATPYSISARHQFTLA